MPMPIDAIRLLIRDRYASFGAAVVLLAVLAVVGKHVAYEQSIQSFFADDDPAVIDYARAAEAFGSDNFVFIAYDDPDLLTPAGMDRVAELADSVRPDQIDAVLGVESLDAMPQLWTIDDRLIQLARMPAFLRRGAVGALKGLVGRMETPNDLLSVAGAIRTAGSAGLDDLRARITGHPLLRGTVVDARGTTTAVVVRLKGMGEQEPKATIAALRERADAFGAKHKFKRPALVGPPVLLADGYTAIEVDGRRLAIVGMALIGLVTLTATRSLWWAIVPIVAGWLVWLATETILAILGLKLSLSGGPLVAQIIVLTMPAVSHLAIHFRDDLRAERDRRLAARSTLAAVTTPIVWCALTGAIGYGALLTSNVVPIRQFGAILGVATLSAAILTLLISPVAMLPPFRLERTVRFGSTSRIGTALSRLTTWVYKHPAPVVFGMLLVVLPPAAGVLRLRNESNYINAFKSTSRVVEDYRFVESRLGGIGLISLIVPLGTEINPDNLDALRTLGQEVRELRQGDRPAASQVVSLATALDPEGRLAALGAEGYAESIRIKLDLIAASPQAELLRSFWDRESGKGRVVVRLIEQQPAQAKEALFDGVTSLGRAAFGPEVDLTGLSYLLTQTTRGVIATQWSTFTWSALGIFLMLTLAFRGPVLAVLALLPTLLSVGLVLGLMGWVGVKLDIATALIASVALGLSVDDTFHCLLLFRRHRATRPFEESLMSSYAVTGPGVLLSSFAVAVGFAVLSLSEFVPFSNFGTMVGIATAGSSLGNLVLLPACLSLGHRLRVRFASRSEPASAGA